MGAQAGKNVVVAELAERLKRAKGIFLVNFTGITVEQDTALRRQLRAAGIEYRVVKNRLAQRATRELDYPVDESLFRQPTAIALSDTDPLAPAKPLAECAKKLEGLSIKAALIDGRSFGAADAIRFASVPSKQELIAKMLGSLQSPVSGLVGTLQAVVRELVGVLDAVREKKQSESSAGETA